MPNPSQLWNITTSSQFHFHHWPDGVVVYLEGEGGTYQLNQLAADILHWLQGGQLSTAAIAERLLQHYPDDTLENITPTVEDTLHALRLRGLIIKSDPEISLPT